MAAAVGDMTVGRQVTLGVPERQRRACGIEHQLTGVWGVSVPSEGAFFLKPVRGGLQRM